jgi:hypothetical protein
MTGSNLSAVLCPGGASARVESAGARYDTAPFFFSLSYTVGTTSVVEPFAFQSPTGASHGELDIFVGLAAAAPGDYTSPAGQDCGSGAFTYYLPVPPSVSCDGGAPPNCPPGCGTICSGFGCAPCTPQAPSVSYTANGTMDCLGNSKSALGSWHLSLTSVTPAGSGTGQGLMYFTPHGTLTATMMIDGDGGSGTATLTASF